MDTFYFVTGILAGLLSLGAYIIYIYGTLYGPTRPNRATWWILTLVGLLICISYYSGGARDTIWVALAYVIGPLVIAIISIKKGEGGWTSFDRWCLFGSVISLVFWFLTSSPITALVINIFIDFLGLLPTIKKAYERPVGENRTAWILEEVASLLNLLAVKPWIFAIYVYPIYLAGVNGAIAVLLVYGMYKGRNKPFLK